MKEEKLDTFWVGADSVSVDGSFVNADIAVKLYNVNRSCIIHELKNKLTFDDLLEIYGEENMYEVAVGWIEDYQEKLEQEELRKKFNKEAA